MIRTNCPNQASHLQAAPLQAAVDFAGHKPHPDHFLGFLDRHEEIWDEFVKVHACRGNSESGLDGACFLSRWENKPHPDHFLNFLDRHEGERGISPVGGNLGISSTGTRERILKVLRARFGPNGLQTDVLDVDLKPFGTGLQNLENRARQPPKPHPAHFPNFFDRHGLFRIRPKFPRACRGNSERGLHGACAPQNRPPLVRAGLALSSTMFHEISSVQPR